MKLRTFRAMANLTQQALAERLGISELSVIKYEGGTTIPSREGMLRIYEVTGGMVTPNDFFDLELISPPVSLANPTSTFVAAGLMSGTSMDGIDSALLITDGEQLIKDLGSYSYKYDPEIKLLFKACEFVCFENGGNLKKVRLAFEKASQDYFVRSQSISVSQAKKLLQSLCLYFHGSKDKSITFDQVVQRSTELHVAAIHGLLKETGYKARNVDIIGYHGQTLFHRPAEGVTVQVGDGQRLSDETEIAVVYDFRSNDVKHGGQGAPFAPLYHRAIANQIGLTPAAIVNCGGISNITLIGSRDEDLYAYDCGPGNALIDRFVNLKIGKNMDQDGKYGSQGKVIEEVLTALKKKAIRTKGDAHYLQKKPPKSLDANDLKLIPEVLSLNLQDGCATLAAFTATCIVESLDTLPVDVPRLWVLAGGGWNNKSIKSQLEERLKRKLGTDVRIQLAEQVGWSGEALEAQIFAYLAVRSLRKMPLSLPGTTGVPRPMAGGRIVVPGRDTKKASRSVRSLLEGTELTAMSETGGKR